MKRFLEESLAPVHEIDLVRIEPDADLAERNRQRIEERKAELGPRWIGHQVHAAQRRDHAGDDVRVTIARARAAIEAVRQHANVRQLRRKQVA